MPGQSCVCVQRTEEKGKKARQTAKRRNQGTKGDQGTKGPKKQKKDPTNRKAQGTRGTRGNREPREPENKTPKEHKTHTHNRPKFKKQGEGFPHMQSLNCRNQPYVDHSRLHKSTREICLHSDSSRLSASHIMRVPATGVTSRVFGLHEYKEAKLQ